MCPTYLTRRGRRRAGFTMADLAAVIVIVFILAGAAFFVLVVNRPRHGVSRQMANSTQLRGIHQAMVTFSQGNKVGTDDGYFPGLDGHGNVAPDGPDTGYSGDGTHPGAQFSLLMQGNYFTPDYIINPVDRGGVKFAMASFGDPVLPVNYSYATLAIGPTRTAEENAEWSETLNTSAIVLSDRAIGTGRTDEQSPWGAYHHKSTLSPGGPGNWRGTVVRNDNSTGYETTAEFADTRYGKGAVNLLDHLFTDDPAADDAYLVHGDATTAYSPD